MPLSRFFTQTLIFSGMGVFAGFVQPVSSTENPRYVELVAVYSKIQGIGSKYTTGATFARVEDCQQMLHSVKNLFTNFNVQGLHFEGQLTFQCDGRNRSEILVQPQNQATTSRLANDGG